MGFWFAPLLWRNVQVLLEGVLVKMVCQDKLGTLFKHELNTFRHGMMVTSNPILVWWLSCIPDFSAAVWFPCLFSISRSHTWRYLRKSSLSQVIRGLSTSRYDFFCCALPMDCGHSISQKTCSNFIKLSNKMPTKLFHSP